MNNSATTHLLIALACEAKPIIAYFRLKRNMSVEPFTVYQNDTITLTVTGIGKVSMAAGVAFSHLLVGGTANAVWLNIGIAGHESHPIGSAYMAHKITDVDTKKCWYPPHPFAAPCESETVATVSLPMPDYSDACLYDMEASAFYQIATRFSTGELIQCLKIVSDNATNPAENISPRQASTLVESHLQTIDALLHKQQRLAKRGNPIHPEWYSAACQLWRFSHNERIQLKELSRRWQILLPNDPPKLEELLKTHSRKQILDRLKREVNVQQMNLSFE